MSLPRIVNRDEWLVARKDLLAKEKELTRARDALNAERRELPMVEIDEDYRFAGPDGEVGLADLFDGRPQLIVYHFMFDPSWDEGCSSCTAGTDELSPGFFEHLHTRDTSYAMVSRAPIDKIERYRTERGWDIPWYSSHDSSFNYDFGVTLDERKGSVDYNYRSLEEHAALGRPIVGPDGSQELPGRSCFLTVDGRIFHTYSQYARGLESTGGSYHFLDLTALGRQEDWEKPAGRSESVRGNKPDFSS